MEDVAERWRRGEFPDGGGNGELVFQLRMMRLIKELSPSVNVDVRLGERSTNHCGPDVCAQDLALQEQLKGRP